LIRRLTTSPFGTGPGAAAALASLMEVKGDAAFEQLLAVPDRNFELVERACLRENDARLISHGLSTLIQSAETFTIEAFRNEAKRLLRTARMLGGASPALRSEILRRCVEHPLFDIDPWAASLKETCSTILTCCAKKYLNPVPARLNAWCKGKIQLSPASLERHQRVLSEKLVITRLDLIEQSVLDRVKAGLPVEMLTKDGRHALRLLGSVKGNRRGLRNFLRAYWSGDPNYLSRHPETMAWYRKHQQISPELWERGIPFEFASRELTIQIERDPFEILKLGTYAGTCLAIGGLCSDSAIAVLLDANKKVLYARDRRGKVVARQLVAIADEDRLVCFNVYPLSSAPEVKAAFRDYDHEFARALGVPLHDPGDEGGYRVSSVLATSWWDDGNWDFKTGA